MLLCSSLGFFNFFFFLGKEARTGSGISAELPTGLVPSPRTCSGYPCRSESGGQAPRPRAGLTPAMVALSRVTGMSGAQLGGSAARASGSPRRRARAASIAGVAERRVLL